MTFGRDNQPEDLCQSWLDKAISIYEQHDKRKLTKTKYFMSQIYFLKFISLKFVSEINGSSSVATDTPNCIEEKCSNFLLLAFQLATDKAVHAAYYDRENRQRVKEDSTSYHWDATDTDSGPSFDLPQCYCVEDMLTIALMVYFFPNFSKTNLSEFQFQMASEILKLFPRLEHPAIAFMAHFLNGRPFLQGEEESRTDNSSFLLYTGKYFASFSHLDPYLSHKNIL